MQGKLFKVLGAIAVAAASNYGPKMMGAKFDEQWGATIFWASIAVLAVLFLWELFLSEEAKLSRDAKNKLTLLTREKVAAAKKWQQLSDDIFRFLENIDVSSNSIKTPSSNLETDNFHKAWRDAQHERSKILLNSASEYRTKFSARVSYAQQEMERFGISTKIDDGHGNQISVFRKHDANQICMREIAQFLGKEAMLIIDKSGDATK